MSILLADIISIFHTFIILFVLVVPFTNITPLLILHVTFSICLLVHWIGNNNSCSLTLLESYLRGVEKNESFSHKFISPMYDISSTDWSYICYITVITLMLLSIYNLYNSKIVKQKYIKYVSSQDYSFSNYITYFIKLLEY